MKLKLFKPYPNRDLVLICELLEILQNFKGYLTPPDLEILEQAERRIETAYDSKPTQ